jgi:D-amino-acid dehydrogenase
VRTDVLVVGAGVVGLSAARALLRRGRSVAVLDAGEIGGGASRGNAGLVVPSHSVPLAAPGAVGRGLRWMLDPESPFYLRPRFSLSLWSWLWKFRRACRADRARAALPLLRDLHRASRALFVEQATDCAFGARGLLCVFRTPEGLEEGRHEAALLREGGLPSSELDEAGVRERCPALRPGLAVGAILYPEDAHLDPRRFVEGIARDAERDGAVLRPGTPVAGFETAGRRVARALTPSGPVEASTVVLAAGWSTPSAARDLRLRLPIQPAKGYSLTFERPAGTPDTPLLLMEDKVAVTPMGPRLRLAGTLELAESALTINERRVGAIRRAADRALPLLEGAVPLETWAGLRPCTPDGLPLLGRPRAWDNVVVAAGHAMIGLSLGPVSGAIVADLACGTPPDFDLSLLDPDRFG